MTIATIAERVPPAHGSYERYRVSVREYVEFHEQGFLVVRESPAPDDAGLSEDLQIGNIDGPYAEDEAMLVPTRESELPQALANLAKTRTR